MSLKHKLLAFTPKIETFPDSELGCDVCMRRMNGHERSIYDTAALKAEEDAKTKGDGVYIALRPLLLSLTLCDEKGVRNFASAEEVQAIDSLVLERLGQKALEINGLSPAARAELEKKSPESIGSGSTSVTASVEPLKS